MSNEKLQTETNYELSSIIPLERVQISDVASAVLDRYSGIAHERSTKARAERRVAIVRDFAGKDVPASIIDVAAMSEIAERASDHDSMFRNDRRHMHLYMLGISDDPPVSEEVKALASISYIEQKLGAARSVQRTLGATIGTNTDVRVRKQAPRHRKHALGVDTSQDDDLGEIVMAQPGEMLNLTNQKLMVPLLVKAADTLDRLSNRGDMSMREAKRYARDALEVYAPLCEVLGYDGFALALSNAANSLKIKTLKNYDSGVEEEVIDYRKELLRERAHYKTMARLFDRGSLIIDLVVGTSSEAHDVSLGTFVADLNGLSIDGRYRFKGSYAALMKIFSKRYEGDDIVDRLPKDMLGLTCITKDRAESALVLGQLLEKVSADNRFRLESTVGRAQYEQGYIHIQGDQEYVDAVCEANHLDHGKISSKTISSDDFEVAKLTFVDTTGVKPMLTEVQILTQQSRADARLGIVSHILFKLLGKLHEGDSEKMKRQEVSRILKTIHAQKGDMKDPMPITTWMLDFIDSCQRAGV